MNLNRALKVLFETLNQAFFEAAPDKSQLMVFNRKRSCAVPPVFLNSQQIQISDCVKYLCMFLDPMLRWIPQFQYALSQVSKWSNLLCSVTCCGVLTHPF